MHLRQRQRRRIYRHSRKGGPHASCNRYSGRRSAGCWPGHGEAEKEDRCRFRDGPRRPWPLPPHVHFRCDPMRSAGIQARRRAMRQPDRRRDTDAMNSDRRSALTVQTRRNFILQVAFVLGAATFAGEGLAQAYYDERGRRRPGPSSDAAGPSAGRCRPMCAEDATPCDTPQQKAADGRCVSPTAGSVR